MAEKKYLVLVESPVETQKKLNQWLAQGYKIEIVSQTAVVVDGNVKLISTILREK